MTEQQLQEIETSHYRMPVVLALIAEIRRLREQQGRELIARVDAIEQGNGLAQRLIAERDAALVERDALLVRVDQWRQMADREATAHVEMRAERDAARQEAAAAQAAWASDVAEWKEWLLGAEQARDGWKQRAEQAERERNILSLAVPLEDELSGRIDETCKHLAMQDGYTLNGIAQLLVDVQRRMAADWVEIGRERRQRQQAEAALAQAQAERDEAQQQVAVWETVFRHSPSPVRPVAQPTALPPLPNGWEPYDEGAHTHATFKRGSDMVEAIPGSLEVVVDALATPADLITVLRHAEAAHLKLKGGAK